MWKNQLQTPPGVWNCSARGSFYFNTRYAPHLLDHELSHPMNTTVLWSWIQNDAVASFAKQEIQDVSWCVSIKRKAVQDLRTPAQRSLQWGRKKW